MDDMVIPERSAALQRWLGGRWALYFSHPDDFAQYDFEADRWYVMLEDGLDRADIAVMGPQGTGGVSDTCWIEAVGGRRTLLPCLPRHPGRFVAAYDHALRLQRVFAYTDRHSLPSPLDLATAAGALRQRVLNRRLRRTARLRLAALFGLAAAVVAWTFGQPRRGFPALEISERG